MNTSPIMNFGSWIAKVIEIYFSKKRQQDIFKIAKQTFTDYDIDMDAFLSGKTILTNFLNRNYLFNKVVDAEISLQNILPNGIALQGRIDLLIERDEETLEVIDHKSGWAFYNIWNLNKNVQLKIYENLIRSKKEYDKYKNIILTIDPLRYEPLSIEQSELDNETFLDWLEEMYWKISNDKKYEPNCPNAYCRNCYITNLCPQYKDLVKYNYKIKKKLEDKVKHYDDLRNIRAVIDDVLNVYKDDFKNYMSQQKDIKQIINGYSVIFKDHRLYIKKEK